MRILMVCAALAFAGAANANGFFYGGFADGMEQSRALRLDAEDGGSRYDRLMQQKREREVREQLEKLKREIEELKRR